MFLIKRHQKRISKKLKKSSFLPSTENDDCDKVSTYKRYDVSLPFATGLPESVTFTCTLCETNFNSKKSLQRQIENIHDAFTQVKKGIKSKSLETIYSLRD